MDLPRKQLIGSGTFMDPLIVDLPSYLHSAAFQEMIISSMFGKECADPRKTDRRYFESPRGKPGNGDLCETIIKKDGQRFTVWFDLSLVTASEHEADVKAASQQLVIDSGNWQDGEPLEEISRLNEVRKICGKGPVTLIARQTETFENYGTAAVNPIRVAGIRGLAVYIKSLRIVNCTDAVIGTIVSVAMGENEYPIDQLEIASGFIKKTLIFCIYGSRNDTIYPPGFIRIPTSIEADFRVSDYVTAPSRIKVFASAAASKEIGFYAWAPDNVRNMIFNIDEMGGDFPSVAGELGRHVTAFGSMVGPPSLVKGSQSEARPALRVASTSKDGDGRIGKVFLILTIVVSLGILLRACSR